ncbi:hypothetical protein C8J56DRAFT_870176 [Mycena floridula]|nr:hypothetical protein C8J56DRAFT_870176 [Mycena floridula]
MKLSILPCLVATATLVAAEPLRVIMVSESQGMQPNHDDPVARIKFSSGPFPSRARKGCALRLKEKALSLSNAFRQALGLPTIETAEGVPISGTVSFLPVGGPTFVSLGPNGMGKTKGGDDVKIVSLGPGPHHHHAQHHPHHGAHSLGRIRKERFMTRVHYALMALGPWEGRAVAFVLGCGLGVLLRMIWVLVVISYRTIRGTEEEPEYEHVLFDQYDAEAIAVPAPNYVVYADEKEAQEAK